MASKPDLQPADQRRTGDRRANVAVSAAPRLRESFDTLQGGRAVAAVLVVLFHIYVFIIPERLYVDQVNELPAIFGMGYAGVEFFFALSGFLMTLVHQRDWGEPSRLTRYLRKRVGRIYPIYWIVLGGAIGLEAAASANPDVVSPLSLLANFALVPMADRPILNVSWTLQYEMVFYLMFAVAIISRRGGIALLALWFAACAVALLRPVETFPGSFILSAYNLIFLFGGLAAIVFRRLSPGQSFFALVAGVSLFVFVGASEAYGLAAYDKGVRTVLYGIGASAAIAGLTGLEAARMLAVPGLLKLVGDASYALYLVHLPVLRVGAPVLVALGVPGWMPQWAMTVLLAAGCIVAGIAVHLLIEKPILNLQRSKPEAPRLMPR